MGGRARGIAADSRRRKLEERGLVHRPEGPKSGWAVAAQREGQTVEHQGWRFRIRIYIRCDNYDWGWKFARWYVTFPLRSDVQIWIGLVKTFVKDAKLLIVSRDWRSHKVTWDDGSKSVVEFSSERSTLNQAKFRIAEAEAMLDEAFPERKRRRQD
jgi:hypothetical protein